MPILYRRIVQVEIAGFRISGLKIAFDFERGADETTPHGEIAIFNLSADDEARIHERGSQARLDAGYPQTVATIFDGSVERVTRERRDTERLTRVEVGGQSTGVQRLGGTTSRSWDGPITIREIVTDMVERDLMLTVGPLDAIPAAATVDRWAWFDPTLPGLRSICSRVGVRVYEDDGVIRFHGVGQIQSDAPRLFLSPDTGLVGRPAITEAGAEAVSFLMPLARVGGILHIESETVNGDWKIAGVRHRGDNWDGDFLTAYNLTPITETVVTT